MRHLRLLFLCLAAALPYVNHAKATVAPAYITIHGYQYAIELQENSALIAKLDANGAGQQGRHFRGRLAQQANSWVRLSEIAGQWSGIVSLAGEKYLVEDSSRNTGSTLGGHRKRQTSTLVLAAKPAAELAGEDAQCAVTAVRKGLQQKPHSALFAPKVQEVAFGSLCATTINGVCIFAEVEFVFDLEFQQLLGDSAQSTAAAIINMAEGFYESDLGIGFDQITMQFPSAKVFSPSTDARALLDDLSDKKRSERLSFIKNPQALTHLVTGRTFNGTTAGIAFTDVLCDSFGYGVGVSKLITSAGASQAALTALVMAHEIGHNFGASHDVTGNTCDTGFVMEPRVNSSTSSFSRCSIAEIEEAISRVSRPEQCFNFPVDVAISASAENVIEVVAGQAFTTQYLVQTNIAFLALPQLRVVGSVPTAQGRFVSATLNGVACVIVGDGQAYTCILSNPGAVASLQIVALGNESTAAYSHAVSVGGSTDLLDTNADNNQLVASFSVTPALLGDTDSKTDGGSDNANNTLSTAASVPAESNSSGGGGAFADLALLLSLVALLGRGWNRKWVF